MTSFFTTKVVKNFPETRRYATRRSNPFFPKKIHAAHTIFLELYYVEYIIFFIILIIILLHIWDNILRKIFVFFLNNVFFLIFFNFNIEFCLSFPRLIPYFHMNNEICVIFSSEIYYFFFYIEDLEVNSFWQHRSWLTLTTLVVTHFDDVSRLSYWRR